MFTLENMLFYDKTFNDKHTLGVTLLQSIQEDKRENVNVAMENLPADNLKYYDLGSGLVTNTIGSSMLPVDGFRPLRRFFPFGRRTQVGAFPFRRIGMACQ